MTKATITRSGAAASHLLGVCLHDAFDAAATGVARVSPHISAMSGMSGQRYRAFINMLVARAPDPRYLEVGSWMGSTLCSAVDGNAVTSLAIDNWSEFGGPSGAFFQNVGKSEIASARINVLNADFRDVLWDAIGRFNIYLFDGPHAYQDQYDGLALALPALDDVFVFIVDDWNWPAVREGTTNAIVANKLTVLTSIEVRSTTNDIHPGDQGLPANEASDWHNGYFLSVLAKPR